MAGAGNELGGDSDDEDLLLEMLIRNEGMMADQDERGKN